MIRSFSSAFKNIKSTAFYSKNSPSKLKLNELSTPSSNSSGLCELRQRLSTFGAGGFLSLHRPFLRWLVTSTRCCGHHPQRFQRNLRVGNFGPAVSKNFRSKDLYGSKPTELKLAQIGQIRIVYKQLLWRLVEELHIFLASNVNETE